jgi:hypothetical protein
MPIPVPGENKEHQRSPTIVCPHARTGYCMPKPTPESETPKPKHKTV